MTLPLRYVVMLAIGLLIVVVGAALANVQVGNLVSLTTNATLS